MTRTSLLGAVRSTNASVNRPQVMPLLRQILTHASDKEHQLLRAKALECISLVGMAIGKERFREDAHSVLQFMQTLQAIALEPEMLPNSLNGPTVVVRWIVLLKAFYSLLQLLFLQLHLLPKDAAIA